MQSPSEVAERAVVCDELFWILEMLSVNCCEHSQCCSSALCEVKILWFSLILNMESTGSSWGPYQGIILHRILNPEFFLTLLKVPCKLHCLYTVSLRGFGQTEVEERN